MEILEKTIEKWLGIENNSGSGYGYDSGLKAINNHIIYKIDNVPTIIIGIHKNIAKGFILKQDLSLKKCYIAKGHNYFSHGDTLKDAIKGLEEKILANMDSETAINEFMKKFKKDKKYKGTTFYDWHHYLTGSCKAGRDNFVKNNQLNLNKFYSVMDFINLTENDYGGEIIKKLKKYYKEEEIER